MPTWCVSSALVMNGEIEIGVIHDPNVDGLYAARRGGGTFLNGKRQPVPPARSVKDGLFGTGFSHRSRPEDVVPLIHAPLRHGGMLTRNRSAPLMLAPAPLSPPPGHHPPPPTPRPHPPRPPRPPPPSPTPPKQC